MPRQKQNLEKVTVRLASGTTEALQELYPSLGYNAAIRRILTQHIRKQQEKLNQLRSQRDDRDPFESDFNIELSID